MGREGGPLLEPTRTQLPATIQQTGVTANRGAVHVVPALIADLGDEAGWRHVEFVMANVRNPHTRGAHLRACNGSLDWCEDRSQTLAEIRLHNVTTYVEDLQVAVQTPSVKQRLADYRYSHYMVYTSMLALLLLLRSCLVEQIGEKSV